MKTIDSVDLEKLQNIVSNFLIHIYALYISYVMRLNITYR